MVDIPNTIVDLPNTVIDLPYTMVDLRELPIKKNAFVVVVAVSARTMLFVDRTMLEPCSSGYNLARTMFFVEPC